MKTIIINASPRKNWNTYKLLKGAQKGAESAGGETKFVDLYDLNFSGCRGCLACKAKNGKHEGCYFQDDLTPIIKEILEADNLIIGSPIYYGEPTASFRAIMERLIFCVVPYEEGSYFDGNVNIGFIYTMNAPKNYYESALKPYLTNIENLFKGSLHGEIISYAACDTLQVNDYSKFDMGYFSEEDKKRHQAKQFPIDLKNCFEIGVKLNSISLKKR